MSIVRWLTDELVDFLKFVAGAVGSIVAKLCVLVSFAPGVLGVWFGVVKPGISWYRTNQWDPIRVSDILDVSLQPEERPELNVLLEWFSSLNIVWPGLALTVLLAVPVCLILGQIGYRRLGNER
jgi:hypothetical protein